MNLTQQLQRINLLNSNVGANISNSREFYEFESASEFIDETIEVLSTDNLSHKKNYFLDNQEEIQDSLQNMHNLLDLLQSVEQSDQNVINLVKLVAITIKHIEDGIARFNSELMGQITKDTVKETVEVTQDTITEAMSSNEGTKKIVEDLKDIKTTSQKADEKTEKIREGFNNIMKNKGNRPQQNQQQKVGYLITDDNFTSYCFVPGSNLDKKTLNEMLQKSGIKNAKLYKLNEIPTHQKQIQTTITVVS